MSKMVSPAGDMEVTIRGIDVDKHQIRVEARFGVWDSQLYFTLDDISHIMRLMLNLPTILFILRFPILYVSRRLFKKGGE